jgi:hypothetical protein
LTLAASFSIPFSLRVSRMSEPPATIANADAIRADNLPHSGHA